MSKTVLLVEDDFFIRDLYRIALEQKGHTVMVASTAGEARKAFDEAIPDVVLLDIMLPDTNGIEVLKYIRQQADKRGKTPVIMVTNLDTTDSMNQALELGANDYWVKSMKKPTDAASEINHYVIDQTDDAAPPEA